MKRQLIRCAIMDVIGRDTAAVKRCHDKKFDCLVDEKRKRDKLIANPNSCVVNLTGTVLSQEQCDALQYGLKYGLAVRPRETDLLATAESIWEQLERNDVLKDDVNRIHRLKNSLRGMTFNFLNFEDDRIHKDNKRIQIVRNMCKTFVLLKPDKGGGVVVLKKSDYVQSMESLFMDRTKFKVLHENPTSTRLASLQDYLLKLKKRGSISEEEFTQMRPKNARPARAFGNPKTHKVYERIPKFRPVIDTTGTSHYSVGKFLSNLLSPLQQNEHTLKDSFDAADRIRNIPPELHEAGYKFVSFDVESLFTSVPLKRTLSIIERRVYTEKMINTKLSKRELKKLIKDTCTLTPFSFNDVIYEQIDGVSMGCSVVHSDLYLPTLL